MELGTSCLVRVFVHQMFTSLWCLDIKMLLVFLVVLLSRCVVFVYPYTCFFPVCLFKMFTCVSDFQLGKMGLLNYYQLTA